jgi:hypothetical protein
MQGLHPLAAHQDENGSTMLFRALNGKNAGAEPSATPMAGMPSARKALGNITNRGFDAENAPPGKTPGLTVRKALGNITNGPASTLKPLQRAAAPEAALASAPADRVEALAAGGVERQMGKGWEELERDREARGDDEIALRLGAFAALAQRSLPTFYPLWVSGGRPDARQLQQLLCAPNLSRCHPNAALVPHAGRPAGRQGGRAARGGALHAALPAGQGPRRLAFRRRPGPARLRGRSLRPAAPRGAGG